jgi:chromosome segregation ATPase
MSTIKELMQKRMKEKPDKDTLAWWNEQFKGVVEGYRGLTHAVNRHLAGVEDLEEQTRALRDENAELKGEIQDLRASVGKLNAMVTELADRLDKARDAYASLKKQVVH